MYLLTAVGDLIRIAGPRSEISRNYLPALRRLWLNMIEKKTYVTGGIGAIKQWEGFGIDYFLPHGTDEGGCYAETCAAIGIMMLAERLLQVGYSSCHIVYESFVQLFHRRLTKIYSYSWSLTANTEIC
jgi:DUF1680 family protein